jgi:CHAD domain-containing protein
LGPPALVPWELAAPELPARPTAADLVRTALLAAAARFIDHLAAVVLDDDAEGVHQARVGIRRIRSDLRSFGPLFELANVRTLRAELSWLSDELGAVRDLDVLLASLRVDAQRLDREDRAGVDEPIGHLERERATTHAGLISAMRSPRFQALLGRLGEVVVAPPFAPEATEPAADLMPALVRRSLRQLRQEVDHLGTNPGDAELHRVRILAKRLRYATDVSVPVAGKPARRAAGALGRLQDLLGGHNDACMAVTRLRELSVTTTPGSRWSTGLLGGLALARAAARREEFPAVYAAALAGRNWAWAQ